MKLSLRENPEYQDAFFLGFESLDHSHDFSTLVAYEGKNGYVMGHLIVRSKHATVWYQHAFKGVFTDITDVLASEGKLQELRYSKIFQGQAKPAYELRCPLE
jgi:hypothetical protein